MKTNLLGFIILGLMFFGTFMTGTLMTNNTKDIYIHTMQTQNLKLESVNLQLKAHNNALYTADRDLKVSNARLNTIIGILQKQTVRGVHNSKVLDKLSKNPSKTVIQRQPVKIIHIRVPVLVPVVTPAPQHRKKDPVL